MLAWPWQGGWCISAPGWAQGCRLRLLPAGGGKEWSARLVQHEVCRGSPTAVLLVLLCKWETSHHLIRLLKGCFFLWEKHFEFKKRGRYMCVYVSVYIYTYKCIHKWQRVPVVYIVIILVCFFFFFFLSLWLWLHRQNNTVCRLSSITCYSGHSTDGCQSLMITAADYLAILWTPFSTFRRACPRCYSHGYGQIP